MKAGLLDREAKLLRKRALREHAVLSAADTAVCDAYAVESGVASFSLMQTAGSRLAEAILQRWGRRPALIACGPGNNGGDGYICAARLLAAGWPVTVAAMGDPEQLKGDARKAYLAWDGPVQSVEHADPSAFGLIVDALFGAGLDRPLTGAVAEFCQRVNASPGIVVAVDLPSGQKGDAAEADGPVIAADLTMTFHTAKPAHLLEPAASVCGERVVVDIGIPDGWESRATLVALRNSPALWADQLPVTGTQSHKHQRGRLLVFTGDASSTGAGRLAGEAGSRAGAGLVTLASPVDAVPVNAAHSTAVMVRPWAGGHESEAIAQACRADVAVIGPGAGIGAGTKQAVESLLTARARAVLDADALTSYENDLPELLDSLRPDDVLTPHVGEFRRIFPGVLEASAHKLEAACEAAHLAGCTVLLKGPDTIIAAPGRTAVINRHASPVLATAGSGDVLAGVIGGLMAQGMGGFDAACGAAWLHGDAGQRIGTGLTAERLLEAIGPARNALDARLRRQSVQQRLLAG